MAVKKGGLGKGLDALFVDNEAPDAAVQTLRIAEIEPNRDQPRREFDEAALGELADSIARHGVLQPLLVRPLPAGGYQLVAGERRWRASRMAGVSEVPVVIREMTDHEAMELALVENLQREDLNPLEEAEGYRSLMESYGLTQEGVAQAVGKSRPAVANALRLLGLPEPVRGQIRAGAISAGHGRALAALPEEAALAAASEVRRKGLSVRQTEQLARRLGAAASPKGDTDKKAEDHYYTELALALEGALGRKVEIRAAGENGLLSVSFHGREDLAALAGKLAGEDVSPKI